MMAVARYWESISYKTKILFSILTEKTQSTFILDNGSNFKINNSLNENMTSSLKNLTEKWGMKAWIFRQEIKHFVPIHSFIFNAFQSLSVVIQ